nr:hypothetical protein 24.t00018 [Brassica oleracea]
MATSLSIGGSLVSLSLFLGVSSLDGDETPSRCLSSKHDGDGELSRWISSNGKGINQVFGTKLIAIQRVLEMDSNPFMHTGNFVDLLSQQSISFANYEDISTLSSSQLPSLHRDDVGERRERKTWTPTDDILLISSWLNTSKDPVVSNEQKAGTFWKRVAAYFNASPKAAGGEERTPNNCKQRWHKINDLVCKFCGAYEAATREKTSGCNENDVLKRAHEIYHNNLKKKFTLEHAWKELRNDQKWCEVASARNEGSSKKRKCEDAEVSSAFQPSESKRPADVKASKARGKATVAEEALTNGFQSMWDIKQKDLEVKERLSKMKILESLIAKTEPLAEYEEALKKKLISDLMWSQVSRSGALCYGVKSHGVYCRVEQSESGV